MKLKAKDSITAKRRKTSEKQTTSWGPFGLQEKEQRSKLKGSVPKGQVPHVPIATRNEGALTEPRRGRCGNFKSCPFPHSRTAFENKV